MAARIIDGKAVSARLKERVAAEAARLEAEHGIVPGLATVLVGNDPASEVYVRNKGKTAEALGFNSVTIQLPADASEAEVLGAGARAERRPIGARHPGADAAAQAGARRGGAGCARSGQGCRCADARPMPACCSAAARISSPARRPA